MSWSFKDVFNPLSANIQSVLHMIVTSLAAAIASSTGKIIKTVFERGENVLLMVYTFFIRTR